MPEITVFLQADEKDLRHGFKMPVEYVSKAKNNISCRVRYHGRNWGRIRHVGKWRRAIKSGAMRRAELNLGEFYKELFGFGHPQKSYPVCVAGSLAATRDMIRKHPIEFYRKAISFVDDHPDPEEGHYFERLWASIFPRS